MPETPAAASIVIPEAPVTAVVWETPARAALLTVWRDRGARVAIVFLAVLALAALFAPWIAPFHPSDLLGLETAQLRPPSLAHWLGTDSSSRDVLSRMLHGARVSLSVAALSAILSALIGLLVGGVAGYLGGWTDTLLMRLVDAGLAIPRVLLILTVLSLWGEVGITSLVLLLGLTGWFAVSRLARAEALAVREREFVAAARVLGTPRPALFVRHVIPHVLSPVLVAATISMGQVIVLEAGLSALGFGIPQPHPSWGNIIHGGRETMLSAWWLTVVPGVALVATALAVNTVGDRLRAALNPRQLPAR